LLDKDGKCLIYVNFIFSKISAIERLSRGRRLILPSRPIQPKLQKPAPLRLWGVSADFVLLEGAAALIEPIAPARSPAELARGAAPVFAAQSSAGDLPILEQFTADLAAAPEIVGELVALYAEQHPRLTMAFAARAVKRSASGADEIEAAARRREVGGLVELAQLIYAALDCVLPRSEAPEAPPPVVVDIEFLAGFHPASRR
jgi:hypothetical protein